MEQTTKAEPIFLNSNIQWLLYPLILTANQDIWYSPIQREKIWVKTL
jgi:hypothetical protein